MRGVLVAFFMNISQSLAMWMVFQIDAHIKRSDFLLGYVIVPSTKSPGPCRAETQGKVNEKKQKKRDLDHTSS